MAISAASILAMAQVARIAAEIHEQHKRGQLTEEDLDDGWAEIWGQASTARQGWEDSKQSPAAVARRDEEERSNG